MKWIGLAILSALSANSAYASTATGKILFLREQASLTTAGYVRVTVQVSSTNTACGNPYFAYEYSDSGSGSALGKAWTATLLAAQMSERTITLAGDNVCDSFNVEPLHHIDLDQ